MRRAAASLVGEHDYRNFCKIDPSVSNFTRCIRALEIGPVGGFGADTADKSPSGVWAFTVCGSAFLYHQVRCMVAVLFLVGEGLESPEVRRDIRRDIRRDLPEMQL